MKVIAVIALIAAYIACVTAFSQEAFNQQSEIINRVNKPGSTWTAKHNKFSGKTTEELKPMFGVIPSTEEQKASQKMFFGAKKPESKYTDASIPDEFDCRQKFGKCIHPIRNQAKCGSCWAFSASEVLSDRFCIATNGTVDAILSPQDLVSCSSLNMGCNGGNLATTWMYLFFTGAVPDTCLPYVSGDGHVPSCPSTCPSGPHAGKSLSSLKYKAKSIYPLWVDLPSRRVADMQKDMMEHGTIQAAFMVYRDFLSYHSGVYEHKSGELLGGHAIKLVGWGEENGTPYWLVANSWGTDWGSYGGFFRIRRGNDECGIEGGAWAGIPGSHP